MKYWIQTYTGVAFCLSDPKPYMVRIEDIAHSLANLCRYTGHSEGLYTVAQHSVLVKDRVEELLGPAAFSMEGLLIRQWALLHEGGEPYVGDWSSPLKALVREMSPEILQIEKRCMAAVATRFGLKGKQPPIVKLADLELLATEQRDLMGPVPKDWAGQVDYALPAPLDRRISPWPPNMAKQRFLSAFKALFGKKT